MNRTLLNVAMVVAVVGAQAARADDFDGDDFRRGDFHHARPCGPQPAYAPAGQTMGQGHYERRVEQVWVAGTQQQVWVAGECARRFGRRHHHGDGLRCSQGYYQMVNTPGRYENQEQWVWVPHVQRAPPSPYAQNPYRPTGFVNVRGGKVGFSVSVH
jgi:hypothetical protein